MVTVVDGSVMLVVVVGAAVVVVVGAAVVVVGSSDVTVFWIVVTVVISVVTGPIWCVADASSILGLTSEPRAPPAGSAGGAIELVVVSGSMVSIVFRSGGCGMGEPSGSVLGTVIDVGTSTRGAPRDPEHATGTDA